MSRGRVEIRSTATTRKSAALNQSKRNSLFRLRFYGIDQDRLDTILRALRIARLDSGTEFEAVALENICLHFLSTYVPDLPQPSSGAAHEINCTSENAVGSSCPNPETDQPKVG